ncbi:MAG: aldo/keto reductase [Christensenellales bacterium]|jgi:diketogulonate reductase-like aldo/keto reductase
MKKKYAGETYTLSNGVKVPVIALGTALTDDGATAARCVMEAVEVGYRSIDTAEAYKNQKGIGEGIANCGLKREELYITSKVWNNNHGYENTIKDFKNTLKDLQLDYIDQFLIHWPGPPESFIPTWKALETMYKDGLVRAIGVSNFKAHHLKTLMDNAEIMPMVDQLEHHPVFIPVEEIEFCRANGIQLEAWRPICWGVLDQYEIMHELAKKYEKSTTQIALRWHLQRGIRPLPKTVRKSRMIENIDVFDFDMAQEEIDAISALNTGVRQSGQDPDTFFLVEMPIITE